MVWTIEHSVMAGWRHLPSVEKLTIKKYATSNTLDGNQEPKPESVGHQGLNERELPCGLLDIVASKPLEMVVESIPKIPPLAVLMTLHKISTL